MTAPHKIGDIVVCDSDTEELYRLVKAAGQHRDPASLHRSTQALVLLGDDGRAQAEQLAAIRPAIGGTSAELVEAIAGWAEQGLDELIVPGFTLGTGSQLADALDQLITEVAPAFR